MFVKCVSASNVLIKYGLCLIKDGSASSSAATNRETEISDVGDVDQADVKSK